MSSRRKARILAFQALYAWNTSRISLEELLAFSWVEQEKLQKLDTENRLFAAYLIKGTIENIELIDKTIQEHLKHWLIDRVQKVDLALLRISTYTLMFQSDIPYQIVIDEAIEIAKEYGTDESYRFVNGVLDSIRKSLQVSSS